MPTLPGLHSDGRGDVGIAETAGPHGQDLGFTLGQAGQTGPDERALLGSDGAILGVGGISGRCHSQLPVTAPSGPPGHIQGSVGRGGPEPTRGPFGRGVDSPVEGKEDLLGHVLGGLAVPQGPVRDDHHSFVVGDEETLERALVVLSASLRRQRRPRGSRHPYHRHHPLSTAGSARVTSLAPAVGQRHLSLTGRIPSLRISIVPIVGRADNPEDNGVRHSPRPVAFIKGSPG